MPTQVNLRVLYVVFALSGFSGLIYESIWSRYLGLFLGHAAYAQTLVLSIFMGGMALGSWFCSRWSARWRNLLQGYAVVEGVIGLCAVVFHEGFTGFLEIFFGSMISVIPSSGGVLALKWGSAALLILPQSILLGMTFPLMSGGILRRYPGHSGEKLAMLYFCNSIGGVVGVLASGFVLIGLSGLPGTIRIAGMLNVSLAIAVWFLARAEETEFSLRSAEQRGESIERKNAITERTDSWILLGVSMLTGTASFVYEIGWIRMLSMVLGSSTHSFELMLSAFILGLALGGLWIHRRIDKLSDPIRFLALVQVLMGTMALSTLLVYGSTFKIMQWLVNSLPKTGLGYLLFNLSSHGIAIAVMLPTTFCAGMTLPLITYVLMRKGSGESSIGAVYSANTVGAIVGIVFAVHFGLPVMGLRNMMVSGAAIDISLGFLLLVAIVQLSGRLPVIRSAAGIAAIAATLVWVQLDSYRMASGVFRRAQAPLDFDGGDLVLSHSDGKTATIDVVWQYTGLSVRTNGKIDATVNKDPRGEPTLDEGTMVLSGALPIILHPRAKTAANIGMGSGLTSQLLLTTKVLNQVDTVEIEQAMVEAARHFRPRNELVFSDHRSGIYIEDAKTFFSTQRRKYDIIVSEPSNPWVSGVAGLFSSEFYDLIARHLNEGGILVQWLQLYEIDVPLVASVLKALSPRFTDYHVYAVNSADILIVATNGRSMPRPDGRILKDNSKFAAELARVGITGIQDIETRKIASKRLLQPWLTSLAVNATSDYYPKLDVDAERARFLDLNAVALLMLRYASLPILDLLEPSGGSAATTTITPYPQLGFTERAFAATVFRDQLMNRAVADPRATGRRIQQEVRKFFDVCRSGQRIIDRTPTLFKFGLDVLTNLQPTEQESLWERLSTLPCASGLQADQKDWLALYKAVGMRDSKAMARIAEQLLDRGVPPEYTAYVVSVAMLANRAQGNDLRVHSLWNRYRPKRLGTGWSLLLDVLHTGTTPRT